MKDHLSIGNRGVSPVIGVILMVAITVILAAVIGTFVLGLGSGTQANPQAGVTISQNPDDGKAASGTNSDSDSTGAIVRVTLASKSQADYVTIQSAAAGDLSGDNTNEGSGSKVDMNKVGEVIYVENVASGDVVTVTATYQGKTVVIQEYTVK